MTAKPFKLSPDKRITLAIKLGIDQTYQHEIIVDESLKIIVDKSRSIGISFAVAFKKLLDAYENPRKQFVFVSHRHDNVGLLMKYVRDFHNDISQWFDVPAIVSDSKAGGIIFSNGAMIISLPCDPKALRTWHGDVWLDEYAYYENDSEIMASARGCLKPGNKQLIITSSPDEENGEFYNIWNNAFVKKTLPDWKAYVIPYTKCLVKGMIEMIEQEKQEAIELGRFEEWEREYMCKFTNRDFLVFTRDMLNRCIAKNADGTKAERVPEVKAEFGGMDFAKRMDSSVLRKVGKKWKGEKGEKIVVCDEPLRMKEGYTSQIYMTKDYVKAEDLSKLYIDGTGVGVRLSEELEESEIGYKIQSITFDNTWKERSIMFLYSLISAGKIILPDDKILIDQLHELKREKTLNGGWRYTHKRSGHDDEVWALCLALQGYIDGESSISEDDVMTVNKSKYRSARNYSDFKESIKNLRM